MKRKFLCALLCLALMFGIAAVDAFAVKLDAKDVDWGLTLRADEITPTGMVVVIAQSGGSYGGDLEYGSPYHLEHLTDNGWEQVPYQDGNGYWTLEAYGVPPESIFRMEVNWERLYGELPHGHYRFVKKFTDFRHGGDGYDDADFYVEFVITDSHTCISEDHDLLCDICLGITTHDCTDGIGDNLCDICGKKISDRDIFRVIGSADWLGKWSLNSNLGLMTKTEPGSYKATFRDVQPGTYDIQIIKNDNWRERWGGEEEYYSFTVDRKMDVTVTFTLKDGVGVISVFGPVSDGSGELDDQEKSADTADRNLCLLITLLLTSSAALGYLLISHKKNTVL